MKRLKDEKIKKVLRLPPILSVRKVAHLAATRRRVLLESDQAQGFSLALARGRVFSLAHMGSKEGHFGEKNNGCVSILAKDRDVLSAKYFIFASQ